MDNKQATAEWIAQQRAVCDAATPGPWAVSVANEYPYDDIGSGLTGEHVALCGSKNENTQFIITARTVLPAALDALEASMQREAEKDATIARLTAEAGRISLAEEEKDTMMKRRKEQIEVIRMRVDKDGLCDVEKRMLNDLKLPSNYDRRLTDTRRERGDLND